MCGRVGILLAAAVSFSSAAVFDADKSVDEVFRSAAGGKLPGAAVAVVRDGRVLVMKGYGMADVSAGVPNSPATIFRLASVTKSFTAIAVLQLVEAGKLKLDDPLSLFVPDFPNAAKIRISHLLSHTAGVPDFMSYEEARQRPLEFHPGSHINYSNNGYYLLGRIVEKVAGQPWDEYLRDHIFAPVGMKHSGYDRGEVLPARATGYLAQKDGSYQSVSVQDARGAYAAGGLYSTVEDLVRWEQALSAGKLLRKDTLDMAYRPGVLRDGRKTAYGFGFMTSTYRGLREVGHGGDITGFNTYVARYPDENFTVIVLSNFGMRPPGAIPTAADAAHRIAEIWLADRMEKPGTRLEISVPASTLQSYVGTYKMNAPEAVVRQMGSTIVVTLDGTRLIAEANGMKLPLDAKSETVFQAPGSPAELTFVPAGHGKCPALVITLLGLREFQALRVD
jgi:CubicO group peptidase (beta-lactamase class C family)